MPINQKPLGILIGIFTLFAILDGLINKTFKLEHKKRFFTGRLFFLIHLISVIYSDNQERAWFDIEVKLSLFVFPILFQFKNSYLLRKKEWILYSFVLGSIASSIIMLIIASSKYSEIGSSAFYYNQFSLFHPSYMAMYFIFAIAILIRFMVYKKRPLKFQIPAALSILLLLRIVFLLQSKAGIITIIIISIFLLIISLIKLRSLLLKIALAILVLSITLIMVQKSSRLQAMLTSVEEISETGESKSSTGIRLSIWKITMHEISKHWVLGVGAGDIKPVLFKEYQNLKGALEKNLNVHNQYLETFLGQGILGISLLLALFYFGFKEAIRKKEWFLSVFLILMAISFSPESILNKEAGVVFFAFFYYFLFTFPIEDKKIA